MEGATNVFRQHPIEWNGRTYSLPEQTLQTEREFQQYLEAYDLAKVQKHASGFTERLFEMTMATWRRDCARNIYAWMRPGMQDAVTDPVHTRKLLQMMLGQVKDQHLTDEQMFAFYKAKAEELHKAFSFVTSTADPQKPAEVPPA